MDSVIEDMEDKTAQLLALQSTITEAEEGLKDARDALSFALANLSKAEHKARRLRETARELEESLVALQHQLLARRRVVANLPTELLRAIFQVFVDNQESDLDLLGHSEYDAVLARQPFALAAVCQRWRQLALETPNLWAYLGVPVPSPPINANLLLKRIKLVLSRSRNSAVDVILQWFDCTEAVVRASSTRSILEAVISAMPRWRTFEFYMPTETLSVTGMNVFRHPTPLLERAWLQAPRADGDSSDAVPDIFSAQGIRYFPACPRLREFGSHFTNVVVNAAPYPQKLRHLRMLNVTVDTSATIWLWNALRMMPRIEALIIGLHNDSEGEIHGPKSELRLPALRQLDVDRGVAHWFAAASKHLRFPSLIQLDVEPLVVDILGHTFVTDSCSQDGITQLNISYAPDGGLDAHACTQLQLLTRLESIHLDQVPVGDSFFEPLHAPQADGEWLLPNLTTLIMTSCLAVPTDPFGDLLVHFVRTRVSDQHVTSNVSRLTSVRIDDTTELASWHRAEMALLLQEESLEITHASSP